MTLMALALAFQIVKLIGLTIILGAQIYAGYIGVKMLRSR